MGAPSGWSAPRRSICAPPRWAMSCGWPRKGRSRVYGISLKDRAAILPAGQSANGAFWIDNTSGQFTTSTYYMEHLPEWATAFNASGRTAQAEREANAEGTTQFFELVGRTPAANSYELDFAKALITGEKLGQNGVTDLVVVSLSPNDIQGHQFGPDSDFEQQMILCARSRSGRLQHLARQDRRPAECLDGADRRPRHCAHCRRSGQAGHHTPSRSNMDKVYQGLNEELNKRHAPRPEARVPAARPGPALHRARQESLQKGGRGREDRRGRSGRAAARRRGRAESQPAADTEDGSAHGSSAVAAAAAARAACPVSSTRGCSLPTASCRRPSGAGLLAHSYAEHGNWYVMMVLDAYQMAGTGQFAGTNHFSPWSYDRHVPLAFYGAPFVPGEYHERVAPVDLAVTFASLAGVNRPSAAVGRVLTEAMKTGSRDRDQGTSD